MRQGLARGAAALSRGADVLSTKHVAFDAVISTFRTLAAGVVLLVKDARTVYDQRGPTSSYRRLALRRQVVRDLGMGLPLLLFFNVPIVGNLTIVLALAKPNWLPVCWMSHRQRIGVVRRAQDRNWQSVVPWPAVFARRRRAALGRLNGPLSAELEHLTERELEEALVDRRVALPLLDEKPLPRFTPDENGRRKPISRLSVVELRELVKLSLRV